MNLRRQKLTSKSQSPFYVILFSRLVTQFLVSLTNWIVFRASCSLRLLGTQVRGGEKQPCPLIFLASYIRHRLLTFRG